MTQPTDLTGRRHITWNVLTSWAAHSLYIAAGFILPRLIDERLGQDRLGVWDFAWSFVGYFSLVQVGVISSINRYVAKFRAAGDLAGLNRAVSSVSCVLAAMAVIIVALALGAALLFGSLWSGRLGTFLHDAQLVVLLLGASTAAEVALAGFAGVVTGCHRWDLHNGAYGVTCVLQTTAMIAVVVLGGGLPALAAAHAGGELTGRILRVWLAYRLCPGLHIRVRLARWGAAREMLHFGSKVFIPQIGDLLLNQTISVLILSGLGTGALAIFSRPRSLLRHADALVSKLAFVVAPTISSLDATQQLAETRDLFIRAARYGVYIALPLILGLAILGRPLLWIWMGPDYARGTLLIILALGSLASITQQPVLSVLFGLNSHGRAGLLNCAASLSAVGLAYIAVNRLQWGLVGAALAVAIPLTITGGVLVPLLACRRLQLSPVRYVRQVWWPPAARCLPFACCLLASRTLLDGRPLWEVAAGLAAGIPLLLASYYRHVVPMSLKALVAEKLSRRWLRRAETIA